MGNNLILNIDVESLVSELQDFKQEIKQDLEKGVALLAASTHSHVREMAEQELSSSTFMEFNKSLSYEEIAPGVFVISIAEEALWIEDGLPAGFDMKPGLLKNGKTGKNGSRYQVIPFDYGTTPSKTPTGVKSDISFIERELKKIPENVGKKDSDQIKLRKIEVNADGSPRIGKLHEFNFGNKNGALKGPGKSKTPQFSRLTIYQTQNPTTGEVKRSSMTFRTVSNGPGSAGKWIHPGKDAKNFMDKALDFAEKLWESKILPEILSKYK